MDVIAQFYAEVRIHQMLSYLTYCHASNFDNIPFIEKTTLIYTPLSTLMPANVDKSVGRVVAPILLHKRFIPLKVEKLQKFSIFYNESLNTNKSPEARSKRSLVSEIGEEMRKKKKIEAEKLQGILNKLNKELPPKLDDKTTIILENENKNEESPQKILEAEKKQTVEIETVTQNSSPSNKVDV